MMSKQSMGEVQSTRILPKRPSEPVAGSVPDGEAGGWRWSSLRCLSLPRVSVPGRRAINFVSEPGPRVDRTR